MVDLKQSVKLINPKKNFLENFIKLNSYSKNKLVCMKHVDY